MKKSQNGNNNKANTKSCNGYNGNGFIPNSFKFISSCIKTVSSNVRSAGASVSGSISGDSDDHTKDQVLWASFDGLELGPHSIKRVLLLGYSNGFQVLDVEDGSHVSELVSRRDDPATFLQMQPFPAKSSESEGFRSSHPLLIVVAADETRGSGSLQNVKDGYIESQSANHLNSSAAVRFYSFKSHSYVHVLRFRSAVYMVRCSSRVVAVGLAAQIYCFDAVTYENKFSVLTHPIPQLGSQGTVGVNIGYGPMAVGPRWLAYASSNPLVSNTGRLSPQSLSPSPGVSPSTSPGNGSLVARYAMESSKQLAAGLINLGDIGYKTLSKYCHELLPDGSSSPVSSNSNWKVGRAAGHSAENDTAGMVVIKDYVSKAIVSQFRAHTSPISALCFDPSGTLLVTASIHGNNINIFRIMPSGSQNGSDTHSYDWNFSHVHLYKLHRGMTSAVIQDICFSHYSQWVAIVSSRGTCHIFVLSPFGGETGLQLQNSHVDGPTLLPILSVPWWSASSFVINQPSFSPPAPAPITLSVVSRIKNGNSGWLNTVSNAASSAAGKVSTSSGVVAAVFHSSVRPDSQPASSNSNVLEQLLVCSLAGHLIQYELLPSMGGELVDSSLRTGTGSLPQMQEEELKVKVEAVQWWDVCRRAEWPEREECINGNAVVKQDTAETVMDTSDREDNLFVEKNLLKRHEQFHWYLSNAEVQIKSGRISIWQKPKIYFYTMSPWRFEEQNLQKDCTDGVIEIEKITVHEVAIKRRDLLPVFDHFHRIHPDWTDDRALGVRYSALPSNSSGGKELSGNGAVPLAKSGQSGTGWVGSSESGSSGTSAVMHDLDQMGTGISFPSNLGSGKRPSSALTSSPLNPSSYVRVETSGSVPVISSVEENSLENSSPSPKSVSPFSGGTFAREAQSSNSVMTSEVSNTSSNSSDISMNILDGGPVHEDMHEPLDFGKLFQDGYCKASTNDENHKSTELVTVVDCSNDPCNKEQSDEDGDSDDMLGGVFAFSEEG